MSSCKCRGYSALLSSSYFERINDDDDDDEILRWVVDAVVEINASSLRNFHFAADIVVDVRGDRCGRC